MKKWFMLIVCSALFFAADAHQAPANNSSNPTTQSQSAVNPTTQSKSAREKNGNIRQGNSLRNHPAAGNKIYARHRHKEFRRHLQMRHHRRHLRRRFNRFHH